METIPSPDKSAPLYVDDAMKNSLRGASGWSGFLAVIGFIILGITVVISLYNIFFLPERVYNMDAMESGSPIFGKTFLWTLLEVVMAIISFFPCLYLLHFSKRTKKALQFNDQPSIRKAFWDLYGLYRYVGVLAVLWLAFIGSALLGNVVGSSIR